MNTPLVVLTYPGHLLLTGITITSYFKFNSYRPVIVVLDDLSEHAWPGYIEYCKYFYSTLVNDISFITTSEIPEAKLFGRNKWVRQQIVKLYLNSVIESDLWLFTDGDVEFCCLVPLDKVPFTIVRPDTKTQVAQNRYVSKILKLNQVGIFTEHPDMNWSPGTYYHQVCVSNPPWRWMNSKILVNLQTYVKDCHGMSLSDFHLTKESQLMLITEWELLANFEQYILQRPLNLVYFPTVPITNALECTDNNIFCKTCYCADAALGREWFANRGIVVPDVIWQTISLISR